MTAQELARAAMNRDPSGRAGYLRQACAGDEALLAEALAALQQEERAQADTLSLAAPTAAASLGSIGPYKLIRQIGEGGMGVVYHARQQEPIRRDVALKVIKPGMDSRQVIARFESERQTLALMDHPNIARVFDAGTTEKSLPFFVMELVDGVPITAWCDARNLNTRQRIDLFLPVCRAIQHAHQKGIIHRDIKPSNVLVRQQDGAAVPKVIDFGLAKALASAMSDATVNTQFGSVVGTLDYMSPEQAEIGRQDVDTRADVYSLGALLYELLTGVPPLEYDRSSKPSYLEVLGWIRERPISPPSARLKPVAAKARPLDRELDWIVMKALEKERTRRYETVNGLLRDLERYLAGDPVEAGPPSTAYRLRKFAAKHRASLGTAAAIVLLLAGAAIFSTQEAIRAHRADRVAEAVNQFLENDLLAQASSARQGGPEIKPDPDIKVRTALDRAAATVGARFHDQPEVEASIRRTLGKTYSDLGLYPEAVKQHERAAALLKQTKGLKSRDTLAAMYGVSDAYYGVPDYAKGEAIAREVLDLQRRYLGPADPDTLDSVDMLAAHLIAEGKFEESAVLLREEIGIRQRLGGKAAQDTLHMQMTLGTLYRTWGKYREAAETDAQLWDSARRTMGPQAPLTLGVMGNLAEDYRLQGKFTEAEKLGLETLELKKVALGPEHSETYVSLNNLANVYVQEGKFAESEALQRQNADYCRRTKGPDNPETLTALHNLASAIYAQGRFAEAETIEKFVFENRIRIFGREHWLTNLATDLLGGAYAMQGRLAEAEALHAESLKIAQRTLGPTNPNTLTTMNRLATVYRMEGKLEQAEALQTEILAGMKQSVGPDHPRTLIATANLALSKHLLHKENEAIDLLGPAIATYERIDPEVWHRFRCESILGASLAGQKKFADAEPHLLKGYQGMVDRKSTILADSLFNLTNAGNWVVQLYRDWGKPNEAAQWQAKLQAAAAVGEQKQRN